MTFDTRFVQQAELLLDVLPVLNEVPSLALKGGTAINLFVQNIPRLSVDIDLTYIPIERRTDFLVNLAEALGKLKVSIKKIFKEDVSVDDVMTKNQKMISKLIVRRNGVEIKIEPNLIFRGGVFECTDYELCDRAQDMFLRYAKTKLVSKEDLYAGKICAALNRQHPRDLFDVKILLDTDGISKNLQKAFVVHLACDARPISELLNPNMLDIKDTFDNEFVGMTDQDVELSDLLDIRSELVRYVQNDLTKKEREFLLSVKMAEPDLSLLGLSHIDLPALRWKAINVRKMDKNKHQIAIRKLRDVLEI